MDTELFRCSKCGLDKPRDDFAKSGGTKSGYRNKCKSCYASYMRGYYRKNPDQYKKHQGYVSQNDKIYHSNYHRHGLTKEQFDAMVYKYDGLCWACKSNQAANIDHDHKHCPGGYGCSECVRGVLCNGCNSALGFVNDSTETLSRLIEYLAPVA